MYAMPMSPAQVMEAEGPRMMEGDPAFTITEQFMSSPIQNLTHSTFRTQNNVEHFESYDVNTRNWKEQTGRSWGNHPNIPNTRRDLPTVGMQRGTGPGYVTNGDAQGIGMGASRKSTKSY